MRSNGEYTATQPEKIISSSTTDSEAVMVTVRLTEPSALSSTTWCSPRLRSSSVSGVIPRNLPSTSTRAAGGTELTCSRPVVFRIGTAALAATGAAGPTGRSIVGFCVPLLQYEVTLLPTAASVAMTATTAMTPTLISHTRAPSDRSQAPSTADGLFWSSKGRSASSATVGTSSALSTIAASLLL